MCTPLTLGFCDDDNNNAFCSWDGGDCCTSPAVTSRKQFSLCEACACLDCTDKDFGTCVASGTRDKCAVATTSRVITRASTTTTTSTTTVEIAPSTDSTLGSGGESTVAAKTTTVTANKCVKDVKGKCGSLQNKGDGECV